MISHEFTSWVMFNSCGCIFSCCFLERRHVSFRQWLSLTPWIEWDQNSVAPNMIIWIWDLEFIRLAHVFIMMLLFDLSVCGLWRRGLRWEGTEWMQQFPCYHQSQALKYWFLFQYLNFYEFLNMFFINGLRWCFQVERPSACEFSYHQWIMLIGFLSSHLIVDTSSIVSFIVSVLCFICVFHLMK